MSGLEEQYDGRVRAFNLDATTPESLALMPEMGFRNHGLVIRSGAGEVLWKQPDHEVNLGDVREALDRLVADHR